ncbi:MAG: cytochrome c oxidase subunit II [Chitinophagales bacterium]
MMDKFEKRVIISAVLVTMLFIFSILYAKSSRRIDLPECLPYNKTYEEPKVVKLDSNLYQVFAVAQMWQFLPAEIYIPVGSTVDFYLTSKDVVHGFNIYNKNVNMMAIYGGINKTTVKFDEPGVYKIVCHEYCGVGHQNMQGEIVVNYPKAK